VGTTVGCCIISCACPTFFIFFIAALTTDDPGLGHDAETSRADKDQFLRVAQTLHTFVVCNTQIMKHNLAPRTWIEMTLRDQDRPTVFAVVPVLVAKLGIS